MQEKAKKAYRVWVSTVRFVRSAAATGATTTRPFLTHWRGRRALSTPRRTRIGLLIALTLVLRTPGPLWFARHGLDGRKGHPFIRPMLFSR